MLDSCGREMAAISMLSQAMRDVDFRWKCGAVYLHPTTCKVFSWGMVVSLNYYVNVIIMQTKSFCGFVVILSQLKVMELGVTRLNFKPEKKNNWSFSITFEC